jgi:hypothetical protein
LVAGIGEWGELLGYFFWFWLFVFNPECRAEVLREWRESGLLERSWIVVEALASFAVGVVLPLVILYYLFLP